MCPRGREGVAPLASSHLKKIPDIQVLTMPKVLDQLP